jgi:hypothetical protein
MDDRNAEHVAFARSLEARFQAAGVESGTTADMAADLADIVYAAAYVRRLADQLLEGDLNNVSDAERVFQAAARIEVELFTELKHHLECLEQSWPALLDRLEVLTNQKM